jgi:hypothetical protein
MSVTSSQDTSVRRYLFEYRFDGSEWGIEIPATSPDEARERLKALAWARYRGRVVANIPVEMAPLEIIETWIRNVCRL